MSLDRRGYRTEYQLHLSGKQIWHAKAAVMHRDELDSGHRHEKFAGEMNGASNAGRHHIDLTATGFGVGYQLRDALGYTLKPPKLPFVRRRSLCQS
jgi:hypothetical protein